MWRIEIKSSMNIFIRSMDWLWMIAYGWLWVKRKVKCLCPHKNTQDCCGLKICLVQWVRTILFGVYGGSSLWNRCKSFLLHTLTTKTFLIIITRFFHLYLDLWILYNFYEKVLIPCILHVWIQTKKNINTIHHARRCFVLINNMYIL